LSSGRLLDFPFDRGPLSLAEMQVGRR
jgi:hypothetical protein